MKYLLGAINAKYIHSNLAVYSLKAYAARAVTGSADIVLGEYTINHSAGTILEEIFRQQPDVLFLSCYIWNWEMVCSLLNDLPKVLPGLELWLGGPEVSYDAARVMADFPALRGVMVGEGEASFAEIITCYERGGRDFSHIDGVVYRQAEHGEIVPTGSRKRMDLNQIPFPYQQIEDFEHRIIYYESSRGCPFSCSYCLSSIDKQVRFRDLELVFAELDFFLRHQAAQVKFVDRTFNCKKSHARGIWAYILEHDNHVTNFHFEIAADLLEEEDIALFARMRPGLIQLEIGVQSTNPATIKAINRRMDLDLVKAMTARVNAGGNIHQHLDLIAGLPGEGYDSFCQSFQDVYEMKPNQLQLGFLKVLKGSLMAERKAEYGLLFTQAPPYEVLSTKWLSYRELLCLKQIEEMVELYYNSGQFTNTINQLEGKFTRAIELFGEIARWHSGHRYRNMGHSRQKRYEILFEWIKERFPEETERYRDTLIVDYYLRENAKSRPGFARDLSGCKGWIRDFFRQEENWRGLLRGYEGYHSRQAANMTHVEVLSDGRVCLFDYQNRDALNHNAAVYLIGELHLGDLLRGENTGGRPT